MMIKMRRNITLGIYYYTINCALKMSRGLVKLKNRQNIIVRINIASVSNRCIKHEYDILVCFLKYTSM